MRTVQERFRRCNLIKPNQKTPLETGNFPTSSKSKIRENCKLIFFSYDKSLNFVSSVAERF